MAALEWATDLAAREAEIADADAAEGAPFAPGDRVLSGRDLCAHTVTACERHPLGHWLVHWGDPAGVHGIGPAEHYRLAPEGYEDPPASPCPDYSGLSLNGIYGSAGEERRADPAFRARVAEWRVAMDRWRAKWGRA